MLTATWLAHPPQGSLCCPCCAFWDVLLLTMGVKRSSLNYWGTLNRSSPLTALASLLAELLLTRFFFLHHSVKNPLTIVCKNPRKSAVKPDSVASTAMQIIKITFSPSDVCNLYMNEFIHCAATINTMNEQLQSKVQLFLLKSECMCVYSIYLFNLELLLHLWNPSALYFILFRASKECPTILA